MRIDIHLHLDPDETVMSVLDELTKEIVNMAQSLDDLKAAVAKNTNAVESAVVLINGISDRITAAGVDPVALKALTDELDSEDVKLANAVTANTPPGPATPVRP